MLGIVHTIEWRWLCFSWDGQRPCHWMPVGHHQVFRRKQWFYIMHCVPKMIHWI